jgi:PEP-utilising enzyme, mobile domain
MYESVYIMIDFNLGKKSVAFGRSQEVPMPEAADVPAALRCTRELRIPCVMNTGRGTTALHTGDVIRIDGAAGTVEILQRLGVASP